jgi:hypothetical protein
MKPINYSNLLIDKINANFTFYSKRVIEYNPTKRSLINKLIAIIIGYLGFAAYIGGIFALIFIVIGVFTSGLQSILFFVIGFSLLTYFSLKSFKAEHFYTFHKSRLLIFNAIAIYFGLSTLHLITIPESIRYAVEVPPIIMNLLALLLLPSIGLTVLLTLFYIWVSTKEKYAKLAYYSFTPVVSFAFLLPLIALIQFIPSGSNPFPFDFSNENSLRQFNLIYNGAINLIAFMIKEHKTYK